MEVGEAGKVEHWVAHEAERANVVDLAAEGDLAEEDSMADRSEGLSAAEGREAEDLVAED